MWRQTNTTNVGVGERDPRVAPVASRGRVARALTMHNRQTSQCRIAIERRGIIAGRLTQSQIASRRVGRERTILDRVGVQQLVPHD